MRRAHEADAAVFAARAAYLAGFDATATVEAGRRFGIPLSGTLAHSFIEACDSEEQAFRSFVLSSPEPTTLLIDTYESTRALQRVIALARELAQSGTEHGIRAIRIDSGDLAAQARTARIALDAQDCGEIRIVLSGSLDEHVIEQLMRSNVPVDAFGVGTALDVSADAGFFPGFLLSGLAVGHGWFGSAFGEGPLVAAVCVYQQELNGRFASPVADGGYL